jgi:ubiquinone/menaquinone biosynthesis C-methylase UbiE
MEWLLEAEPYVSRIFTPDAFSGRKALEVGCGQGVETYLALQAGASSVVAGDLSYVSVSEARTNLFGSVPDRVRFLNFDAERLPFTTHQAQAKRSEKFIGFSNPTERLLSCCTGCTVRRVMRSV